MNILLTGGAGYIGSHTAVVLAHAGHKVVLLDNFSNSSPEVIERIEKFCNHLSHSLKLMCAIQKNSSKV